MKSIKPAIERWIGTGIAGLAPDRRARGRIVAADDPDLQAILRGAHARKLRPLCLCREPGVPMYVAHFDGRYLVKRLPLSGERHDPACPVHQSYALSGLGPLIGGAIRIDAESGNAILNLGFALSRTGNRSEPHHTEAADAEPGGSVRDKPQKLALRALLHYLWDAAELTEWRAAWHGKRNWHTVRARLCDAAAHMTTPRNGPLAGNLFVPEPFRAGDKEAIAARRAKALAGLHAPRGKSKKCMLILAEIKKIEPARRGHKIFLRHLPDFPLMIDDEPWQKLRTRFQPEFEMWEADESVRLIAIATFGLSVSDLAVIDEIALMSVTENWIPFETQDERRLVDRLARLHEKSVKGLRFDLPADRPGVCATLSERRATPLALYLVPANADETYERHLAEAIADRPEIIPWIWRVAEGGMPALPAGGGYPQSKTRAETP